LAPYFSACLSSVPRRGPGSGIVPCPGFPCRASRAVYQPATLPPPRRRWSLPRASASLFRPAAAWGLRRTCTSSPTRRLSCRLRGALTPSASATSVCRSGTSTSGCAVPPTASRMLCRRFAQRVRRVDHDSAMDARLATGGGLALTRQGRSPCKRRQAFLARSRWCSPAAGSGRDAEANAGGSQVQCCVRLGPGDCCSPCPPAFPLGFPDALAHGRLSSCGNRGGNVRGVLADAG
jgi:hypothetical protein